MTVIDDFALIGRKNSLFDADIRHWEEDLIRIVSNSRFLVLGGAGSIGRSVVKEIFRRDPVQLDVLDISENNLAELVRDLRSSLGYIKGEFRTFALDIGSLEFDIFFANQDRYDFVLNLSALKHVRSERDVYTLMRMIGVNIFNTEKTIRQSIKKGVSKYFAVSTDKAANPVNLMGATKRIMEMYLVHLSEEIGVSTARFANVAFSDGSLLDSFVHRLQKRQPIVAPTDIQRYFLSLSEAGELCLLSCVFGENRDIFFPKIPAASGLSGFSEIAEKFLYAQGLAPHYCESEEEARMMCEKPVSEGVWPCYFSSSDTTGEKALEEFYTPGEQIDWDRFPNIGVIKHQQYKNPENLTLFESRILALRNEKKWEKKQILDIFHGLLTNFDHKETGKYLDEKM